MTRGDNDSAKPIGPGRPVSLLRLEKRLLGELPPEDRSALEAQAAADPELAAYMGKLESRTSPLEWERLQGKLDLPQGRLDLPAPSRPPQSIRALFLKRIGAWFPAPSHPRLVWAGMSILLFFCAATLFVPSSRPGPEIRAKGGARPEIVLNVGGGKLLPGKSASVKAGDVMAFDYRSARPLYVQIWYAEDGGASARFDGKDEPGLFWAATSSWATAPQRIRLEGDWKRQRVLVLVSDQAVAQEKVGRILSGAEKAGRGVEVFTYDLVQP